jgi:sugar phosphate isomerase/epimerase
MTRFLLSTMYAQTARFDDGAVFAAFAADAGFDGVEISHSTAEDKIRAIAASDYPAIGSVHQPAPYRTVEGRPNAHLNLAGLDEGERELAVQHTLDSIRLAAEVGARAVVVHLGHLPGSSAAWSADRAARRQLAAGQPFAETARRGLAARTRDAERVLSAARCTVEELVAAAAPLGITLGLETRLNLAELPLPHELPQLVAGFTPGEVGYWHDVGHAEVLGRLGYVNPFEWFELATCVGAHVHDVAGIVDHRAPGSGDVDLRAHARALAGLEAITLEINQHQPEESVRMMIPLLRSLGFGDR